jgi:hypothetical protein
MRSFRDALSTLSRTRILVDHREQFGMFVSGRAINQWKALLTAYPPLLCPSYRAILWASCPQVAYRQTREVSPSVARVGPYGLACVQRLSKMRCWNVDSSR